MLEQLGLVVTIAGTTSTGGCVQLPTLCTQHQLGMRTLALGWRSRQDKQDSGNLGG